MSNVTTTTRPTVGTSPPTTPTVYNLELTLPGTEYSQILTTGTKRFQIRARGTSRIQYAFVLGESSAPGSFITVPRGKSEDIDGVNLSQTLYLQADQPGEVVEILEWT